MYKPSYNVHRIIGCVAALIASANAAGFRTVGSSGCAAQMAFVPPYTDTVIFLDNYHRNFGGPGTNLRTGAHSTQPYMEEDGKTWVYGVEYSWRTNQLRKLHPVSNTFCSAGAFFPDGTMLNAAGAETYSGDADASVMQDGRQALRKYPAGPCNGACGLDFTVSETGLSKRRWYPTAQTLLNGDIVVVGGSDVGLLVTNEASINVPSYEVVPVNTMASNGQVLDLSMLSFTANENQDGNFSYNLYPIVEPLPNANNANYMFVTAGNRAIVHDFSAHLTVKELPEVPLNPRTFPASASFAMLPLLGPNYDPTVLMCGGSSADAPNPQALDDCYTIKPNAATPQWTADDRLPNGGQVMTDAIILPDDTVLLLNGAHKGCAGGYMASQPVYAPLVYDPSSPAGSRFTQQPASTIPRLYHSVAVLLPSGEVLVAGSNPDVFYNPVGNAPKVNPQYPKFNNHGHQSFLNQQQAPGESHPTEYRVEIFSPPYIGKAKPTFRLGRGSTLRYGQTLQLTAARSTSKNIKARLMHGGFRTHGVGMGQRSVGLDIKAVSGGYQVTAPPNATVMVPGKYMLFLVIDGVPSEASWVTLQ